MCSPPDRLFGAEVLKLHTSAKEGEAEECAERGEDDKMPTDSQPPERSGLLSEEPSHLIITPQKLVPLTAFEGSSRGICVPLTKTTSSGSFQGG